MKESLTAKEWLEKEGIYNSNNIPLNSQIENGIRPQYFNLDLLMERYASYRTKMLEGKIKKFRKKMSLSWYENSEGLNTGDWLEKYDKHFGTKND